MTRHPLPSSLPRVKGACSYSTSRPTTCYFDLENMSSRPPPPSQTPSPPGKAQASTITHPVLPPPPAESSSGDPRAHSPVQSPLRPVLPLPSTAAVATPPSSFRYPSRLTRAQSRSIGSLSTTTPEQHHPFHEFGSSSSLDTSGSSVYRGRTRGRSHGSLPDVPLSGLSVRPTSIRGLQRYPDYEGEDRRPEAEDEPYGDEQTGAHASGASDADSERSSGRNPSHPHSTTGGGPSGSEGMLVPMGESFHVKKKRTRVLPTAHQSQELNRLLAEVKTLPCFSGNKLIFDRFSFALTDTVP